MELNKENLDATLNYELFSADIDGPRIGGTHYPDAEVDNYDYTYQGITHHIRRMQIPCGTYKLSVIWSSGSYSSNTFAPVDRPWVEFPALAEVAVLNEEDHLCGDELFGWDDTILGWQTTTQVNTLVTQLRSM